MTDKIREAIDRGGGQTCDIEGVIRALNQAGYSIVPKEPTTEMQRAGMSIPLTMNFGSYGANAGAIWVAMQTAAPSTSSEAKLSGSPLTP